MIIKRRTKPLPLQKLEVVIPRLSQAHPKIEDIQYDLNKCYKGYIGEKKVDYHLEQLPQHYTILHDVYLKPPQLNSFQIDSLICTHHAIYIIESKNFSDKIIFNTIHNQFTRISNGIEKGYRSPITQAESTRLKLINWLQAHNIHDIPVYYFIAIADPCTIIDVIGDNEAVAKVVGHAEDIPHKITQHEELMKTNEQTKWNGPDIGEMILRECKAYDYDVLERNGVKKSDIQAGIICPKCQALGMIRVYGKWTCQSCHHKSKHAHLSAIADYFILGHKWITNSECKNLLCTHSTALITRLLKTSHLTYDVKRRR